jgi:predicted Rossmann fold nucleotide-binding protein DprA/Smf involved in DNA uptake
LNATVLSAGLCDALLITEAAVNSGSLHTARFALDQGKTVLAVPGNITSPTSEGCNNLIKSGAIPVTNADDVFFALKINRAKQKESRVFRGSPEEEKNFGAHKRRHACTGRFGACSKLDGAASVA